MIIVRWRLRKVSQNLPARWRTLFRPPTQTIAMNKPYQRDEAEQKPGFEGAKRDMQQSDNDTQKDAAARKPKDNERDEK